MSNDYTPSPSAQRYFDDCFFSDPDTLNHQITFCNGQKEWQPLSEGMRKFYQRRVDNHLQEYADLLNS